MVPSKRVSTCRSLPDSRPGKAYWSPATNFPHYTTMFIWSQATPTPSRWLGTRRTPPTLATPRRTPANPVQSAPPVYTAVCTRLGPVTTDSIEASQLSPDSSSPSMHTLTHVLHTVTMYIVTCSQISPQGGSTLSILKIDPLRNLSPKSLFSLPSTRPGRINTTMLTASSDSILSATTALKPSFRSQRPLDIGSSAHLSETSMQTVSLNALLALLQSRPT